MSLRARPFIGFVLVAVFLVWTPARLRGYDVDTHYVWTYYLALHAGFTPRQAFQIASGTAAIDADADTEPLQGVGKSHLIYGASTSEVFVLYSTGRVQLTPNRHIVNVWSRFHAFAENAYVGSGRLLPTSAPSEAEVALVSDVQAAREEHREALWTLATRDGNPGPFLHLLQDEFSHGPYDNLRGHGLHGHAPDFLSNRPGLSWQMTRRTLASLGQYLRQMGGTPRAVDEARIREVFDRMIAANPRRWVTDPRNYDMALDQLLLEPARYVLTQSLFPSLSGVGSPSPVEAWRVVNAAIDEDRRSDRLPAFPEIWFADRPPSEWLQYNVLGDGRAAPGGINTNRYAVERVRFSVGTPTASFSAIAGSPNRAQEVTLRLQYSLAGLANLPFLSPLPVIEDSSFSDFGAQARGRLDRANGTFTIERKIQRSAADLQAGTLVWRVTVHPYGLEPQTRELTIRLTGVPATTEPPRAEPAVPTFEGSWTCPLRGTITFQVAADGTVTGSVSGRQGEHWGGGHREGGSVSGTVKGLAMDLRMTSGDGTESRLTATLDADGQAFSGGWTWLRGSTQLGSGTWACHRRR